MKLLTLAFSLAIALLGTPRAISQETAEILSNPGFDDELTPWRVHNPSSCSTEFVEEPALSEESAVWVFDRSRSDTGIEQDITEQLRCRGPGRYTYSAFARTEFGELSFKVGLRLTDSEGTQIHPSPDTPTGEENWTQAQRTVNLQWNGLVEAVFYVETKWSEIGSFYIDECAVSSDAPCVDEPDPALSFRRGHANGDGNLNLTDAVNLLEFLFLGVDALDCLKSADANDDGDVNLSDAIGVLNFLFLGGGELPPPFDDCGPDPTDDDLTCETPHDCA
ncbi:MAG: dockerin type I repeat-containing protein [Planctomycetota bacterium]